MSVELEGELKGYVQRPSGLLVRGSGMIMPGRATPGDDYQGTHGEEARKFLETMQEAGFNILHDLPKNPPDEKYNCPYSAESAFALDMQQIDLVQLVEDGDLSLEELDNYLDDVRSKKWGPGIRGVKRKLIREVAAHNFANDATPERKSEFEAWRNKERGWLDSYAAYEVLKEIPGNAGKPWQQWEFGKDISPGLITALKVDKDKGEKFAAVCYEQWIAEQQATQYRDTAKLFGIELWGDVPFYTGPAEVWAHPELFNLDADGNQLSQAGVPEYNPDRWQEWGNATYNVNGPETTNNVVDWWVKRLVRAQDISGGVIRLDYFDGFSGPYLLPMKNVKNTGAERGAGIGRILMKKLVGIYGDRLPFYAEDLGYLSNETHQLRHDYKIFPTKVAVLEFEKLTSESEDFGKYGHNPDNYQRETVACTSNHDMPPVAQGIDELRKKYDDKSDVWPFLVLIGHLRANFPEAGINESMTSAELAQFKIARVIGSKALVAMTYIGDALGLGEEGRYNIPGQTTDDHPDHPDWAWRMSSEYMNYLKKRAGWLRKLNAASGRIGQVLAS